MEILRVGSLNINGMRDGRKNGILSEMIHLKELSVTFLQETHSTYDNEVDWGLWWKGEYVLSHGTNLSAGVAVLFSPTIKAKVLSKTEMEPGRCLIVEAEIGSFKFLFVNIYAPNVGAERIQFFTKLENLIKEQNDDVFIVFGGDWNCTIDFTLDRNGEEPQSMSAAYLAGVKKKLKFSDVWREHNPFLKQYTWVKVCNGNISAARLDRFYISQNMRNRVVNTNIIPNAISDHKFITVAFTLEKNTHKSCYWHFNTKLLEDKHFCEAFKLFWETWKTENSFFESITQWWEVGKVHIRDFCQKYTSHSSFHLKKTLEWLETEILDIEKKMTDNDDDNLKGLWTEKKSTELNPE